MDVAEAEVAEAIQKPGGAGGLAEGGSGDADEVELPLTELGLVEVQPVEGSMDGSECGEAGDAALGGGGGHQCSTSASEYRTSTRKRPRAGAVVGGSTRLRAARIWREGVGSGPVPALAKMPTRLRTMWWRKPQGRRSVDEEVVVLVPFKSWWMVRMAVSVPDSRVFGLAGVEVGIDGGEGGEVVGADDVVGCFLEDGEVEREMAVPDVGGQHGGTDSGEGVW